MTSSLPPLPFRTELSAHPQPPERIELVEDLHGVSISDPYRYLEDPDDPRTTAFVASQNEVSGPALAALPGREWFGRTVLGLLTTARAGAPWERGGRYFRLQNPGELDQDVLVTGETLEVLLTSPTVLLDPNTLSSDSTIALNAVSTSPDGTVVAVALSEAGSDWQTIRFLYSAGERAGRFAPDELRWSKFSSPTWLPDSSGVLYWRYPEPSGQQYVQEMPPGELVLHLLGTEQSTDQQIWYSDDAEGAAQWSVHPEFSSDDRWLLLTASPGTDSRTVVQARRVLAAGGSAGEAVAQRFGEVVDVVAELSDAWWPVDVIDDELFLVTDNAAPRRRVVAVALAGARAEREVIAEAADSQIESMTPAGGRWAVVRSVDTAHYLSLVDHDGSGVQAIPLESPAAITTVHSRWSSAEMFVAVTSFTTRIAVSRVELGEELFQVTPLPVSGVGEIAGTRTPLVAARPVLGAVLSERRAGTSADGTQVPMTVVQRGDLGPGPHPTLLYGYGGFDIAMTPAFSGLLAGWVAAGGVAVVANLRGGGEFGQQWHQAGMLHAKQRVFDDLYGCAEALIADGTTTSGQLAVHGRSNGGLLVGAALTQRPELWAATLPTVGVLDMVRFHKFTIGAAWTTEYGNPDDATDFAAIHAYSPLHNLVEGRVYPPTLICTGDHDDRVVPAHSFKFAAELQHVQGGEAPILLRVDTRAGHGAGKPVRALAAEYADQLAFAAAFTGLRTPDAPRAPE